MPECLGCGLEVEGGLLQVKLDPDDHIFCDNTTGITKGLYYSNSATAFVFTSEATTSAVFTDLATPGPSVSRQTGTVALVLWDAIIGANGDGLNGYMSVAVTGASTVAASANYAIQSSAAISLVLGYAMLFTGLTPGLNNFTAKYATDSGASVSFGRRRLTVLA